VAKRGQLASPMVSAATGFHGDSVGGSFAKNGIICARRRLVRSTGRFCQSMPWRVKTALDVSMAMRLYWVGRLRF
jgi:hypothetical protein